MALWARDRGCDWVLAAALAGEGPKMSAESTGKKKRTRKGHQLRGAKKAHLLVSFGDDDDEDASLGA